MAPGPSQAKKTLLGKENNFRLMRWKERKLEGFWPIESQGTIPRGKRAFPLGFSRLSPDALHPGWPLSAAGPEAQCRQAFPFSASNSGEFFFRPVKELPQVRVQGGYLPGGVWGKAPLFSC